jgi:hypothetical protein
MTIIMPDRPITLRGRMVLAGLMLLIALVLGCAGGAMLYQFNRDTIRESKPLGRLLCGPGQTVSDRPSRPRGIRLICRDGKDRETSAYNNLLAVYFSLPFILLLAVPGQWFAWKAKLRMTDGRLRRRR